MQDIAGEERMLEKLQKQIAVEEQGSVSGWIFYT